MLPSYYTNQTILQRSVTSSRTPPPFKSFYADINAINVRPSDSDRARIYCIASPLQVTDAARNLTRTNLVSIIPHTVKTQGTRLQQRFSHPPVDSVLIVHLYGQSSGTLSIRQPHNSFTTLGDTVSKAVEQTRVLPLLYGYYKALVIHQPIDNTSAADKGAE